MRNYHPYALAGANEAQALLWRRCPREPDEDLRASMTHAPLGAAGAAAL
jgi:hypothetical protein